MEQEQLTFADAAQPTGRKVTVSCFGMVNQPAEVVDEEMPDFLLVRIRDWLYLVDRKDVQS